MLRGICDLVSDSISFVSISLLSLVALGSFEAFGSSFEAFVLFFLETRWFGMTAWWFALGLTPRFEIPVFQVGLVPVCF